jgi:hypothetical protein
MRKIETYIGTDVYCDGGHTLRNDNDFVLITDNPPSTADGWDY